MLVGGAGLGTKAVDPVDLFDRLEQGHARHRIAIDVLAPDAAQPVGQWGDVGVAEAISASEEDLDQRGRVPGPVEHREPRSEVGHLGHREQSTEVGHLDRYVMPGEGVDDHGEVPVLPEQNGHLRPGRARLVQRIESASDPIGFCDGVLCPVGHHLALRVGIVGDQIFCSRVGTPPDLVGYLEDLRSRAAVEGECAVLGGPSVRCREVGGEELEVLG